MTVPLTPLAIAVSLAALLWLSFTDPKRRRAFARPAYPGPRRAGLAWTVALLPGPLLAPVAGGPGLVLWLGALTVTGWGLIAIPPGRGGAVSDRLDRGAAWLGTRLDAWGRGLGAGLAALRARLARPSGETAAAPPGLADRVAALEHQVMALRTEVARLRHGAAENEAGEPMELKGARVA